MRNVGQGGRTDNRFCVRFPLRQIDHQPFGVPDEGQRGLATQQFDLGYFAGIAGTTLGQSLDGDFAGGRPRQGEGIQRASIVIGAGSLSFEMIRALVERLPVMIAPRWVSVPAQPIAISDMVSYLLAALDLPLGASRVFEIGGPDQVSYGGLMQEYAHQRGLKRLVISAPVLTPRLSSLWLGLVTPLYVRVGRKLIDSIRHATVVEDPSALTAFDIRPVGFREAITAALRTEGEGFLVDSRSIRVAAPPEKAFLAILRIGGDTGWYYANWLWLLRGAIDLRMGGVGLKRGRRHPEDLHVGDAVDSWRVDILEPDRGCAWLPK